MTATVDLNRLRDLVLDNQRQGTERPDENDKKLFVNAEGKLVESTQATGNDKTLSEVPQETFAAFSQSDLKIIHEKFPKDSRIVKTRDGVDGCLYSFTNDLGDKFSLFAYHDGNFYQVKLVEPVLEDKWRSPHTGHLYSDGRICFGNGYGSGRPSLAEAYSKSVLWSVGISAAIRGYDFPFNVNQ